MLLHTKPFPAYRKLIRQKDSVLACERFYPRSMFLLCAVKSELTYSYPKRAFRVSEIFKESFYQFHAPSEFTWLSRGFKLRSPVS